MLSRRTFVLGAGAFVGTALAGCANIRKLRIAVATAEPWGTYHVKPMLDQVIKAGSQLAQVTPDRSKIAADDPVPIMTPAEAVQWRPHLLVINGAHPWPAEVAGQLSQVPVVASSFTYQRPEEAVEARQLRPRLVTVTAAAPSEARAFAGHLGIGPDQILVVGNPALDELPARAPRQGELLIATSVTKADTTGGAAPGAILLLDIAQALAAQGYRLRIGLHPREDPALWSKYEIASEPTPIASARAEAVVGIPGSVFPRIAAIGTPLVGVMVDGTQAPDYVLELCRTADDAKSAIAAVGEGWVPSPDTLEDAVGPIGGARDRLWQAWESSTR